MSNLPAQHHQFRVLAFMSMIALMFTVGIGVLIIFENVNPSNSLGIEGIVATLKDALMMLIGAVATLAKQASDVPVVALPVVKP